MNKHIRIISLALCIACMLPGQTAGAKTGIIGTKHDLSSKTGPGPYKALSEDRICVFCHTPHNASPQSPLWNKKIEQVNYDAYPPYSSTTMISTPGGPTGPSRLCLSCHDGTLALGEVRLPSKNIDMTISGGIPVSSPSNFGVSLANHHPVSFEYSKALPNPELFSPGPPPGLQFYGFDTIQCTTCHDPHDNTNKKFLAKDNEKSGLCVLCHSNKSGWTQSSHRTSQSEWTGVAPNPWPRTGHDSDFGWTTVEQNGCENCHAPHSAGGSQRLLNNEPEEQNCIPCHDGHVASKDKDIEAQFMKPSKHHIANYIGVHDPKTEKQSPEVVSTHVECVDCHNPHASNSITTAFPPFVSGKLEKVTGVDRYRQPVIAAAREYEICAKCHGYTNPVAPFIVRVVNTTNALVEFDPANPSYHPVIGMGKHQANPSAVPSLPSPDPEVPPGLSTSSYIYCTDCHSDEVVSNNTLMSRGPHGSPYFPILRRQYMTTIGTAENLTNYGLCYRCHNRDSILSDNSFSKNSAVPPKGGHSGHLGTIGTTQVNAPCSVCHDPHGVQDTANGSGPTGSHTYLINFNALIVTPTSGGVLKYTDNGSHHGSCTLTCHDAANNPVEHDGSSTYSY